VQMILVNLTFFGLGVFSIEAQSARATATQTEQRYKLCLLILKERRICKEKTGFEFELLLVVDSVICTSFSKQHIDINHTL